MGTPEKRPRLPFHHFLDVLVGLFAIGAFLSEWLPAVGVAAAIALFLGAFPRLVWLTSPGGAGPWPYTRGAYRFAQAMRLALFAGGLALLVAGHSLGWLPILAASSVAILEGATGFSVALLVFAYLKASFVRRAAGVPEPAAPGAGGNPNCVVCNTLAAAPYDRCRWCSENSIRWCCLLQTSLLLMLLMVIGFLLSTTLALWVTKLLVTLSIVTVVALGLSVKWQTDDLIRALDESARGRERHAARCDFLRRLALADSIESAAEWTVRHVHEAVGAGRISVMLVEGEVLRIAASRGIAPEVARQVAVPVAQRICGAAFSTGRAVIFRDVPAEQPGLALGLQGAGASITLPLVSAPMQAGGRKVGCINATEMPRGEFAPEDVDELEFAAEAAAISLVAQVARRQVEQANYDTIRALAQAVEAKDPYTHGHSLRVRTWSVALGRELGLGDERLQVLSRAAELHDIGKLAVPDEVLKGARRLTEEEWVLMRQHPHRGVQMINHIGFLGPALPAILHHHERLDGGGYPEGLAGEAIPLEGRIMAVVDSYDAMTSARPYRPAKPHEEAAAELRRCAGTQFDPVCVEAFLRLLGDEAETPVGAAAGHPSADA
jgi:putative methionine-R-sulfoxide reductase with GAF domain